jgi:p-hydroxybenzoate 3-monooxygenase
VHTSVTIIGAGPAGLLLGHILHQAGVDFVIVERQTREHALGRIRAGVLEQGTVDIVTELGLDANLRTKGLEHGGIYLQYEGERHHVDFRALVGRTVTVYGQQALVADMLAEHERLGSTIVFEAADVAVSGIDGAEPAVRYTSAGEAHEVTSDFIVGADGYHGVCRPSIPESKLRVYEREYPFAWLGVLADVPPSTDDLIYALHPDGFAMHSMRSRQVSRLYLQVDRTESIDEWSDSRIWEALQTRLGVMGWTLTEGVITEKSITQCAPSSPRRCRAGGSFWPGTPATSCRRPAQRDSTPRSPTWPCSAGRSWTSAPATTVRSPPTAPGRSPGSGRFSTSRSG